MWHLVAALGDLLSFLRIRFAFLFSSSFFFYFLKVNCEFDTHDVAAAAAVLC